MSRTRPRSIRYTNKFEFFRKHVIQFTQFFLSATSVNIYHRQPFRIPIRNQYRKYRKFIETAQSFCVYHSCEMFWQLLLEISSDHKHVRATRITEIKRLLIRPLRSPRSRTWSTRLARSRLKNSPKKSLEKVKGRDWADSTSSMSWKRKQNSHLAHLFVNGGRRSLALTIWMLFGTLTNWIAC